MERTPARLLRASSGGHSEGHADENFTRHEALLRHREHTVRRRCVLHLLTREDRPHRHELRGSTGSLVRHTNTHDDEPGRALNEFRSGNVRRGAVHVLERETLRLLAGTLKRLRKRETVVNDGRLVLRGGPTVRVSE